MSKTCLESTKRNNYIDFLKGTAILLVVVGHCIQYGSGHVYVLEEEFFNNSLYKLIYSFHMPLFILISGFLFAYSCEKYNTKKFIWNRIKSLCVPILCWGGIDFLIALNERSINKVDLVLVKLGISSILSTLWFLWAILFCSSICYLIKIRFNDNIYIHFGILIFLMIVPELYFLALAKFMYPYFVAGYYFNKKGLYSGQALLTNKKGYLFLGIIYLGLYSLFNRNSFVYITGISIFGKNSLKTVVEQLLIDGYRWIIGFVGCILFISITQNCYKLIRNRNLRVLEKFFVAIGKKSLAIYAFSHYINLFILSKIDFVGNFVSWICQTIVIIGVCYSIAVLVDKIKVLKFIMLGGR